MVSRACENRSFERATLIGGSFASEITSCCLAFLAARPAFGTPAGSRRYRSSSIGPVLAGCGPFLRAEILAGDDADFAQPAAPLH